MTANNLPVRPLTAEETAAVQARLWGLLARQTALYTMGDSTSVPAETAQALLASIRFSLEQYLVSASLPLSALLTMEPEALLRLAEAAVRRQTARARLVYRQACRCRFRHASQALDDTLTGMAAFFRDYDPRYFAADVPCDIDYQLCLALPDTLAGVAYIRAYLDRLLVEDGFLRRFAPETVTRLLAWGRPGHRELLVNLYEPVAEAALGVTMAEGDLFALDVTAAGQTRLTALLEPLGRAGRMARLERAAATLASRLELGPASADYLLDTARALAARVEVVLAAGSGWQGLFPAFS